MPILAECPLCGHQLSVPEEKAGQRIICPECRLTFDVPMPEPPLALEEPGYSLEGSPAPTLAAPPDPAEWYFKILGVEMGPVTLAGLREGVRRRTVGPDTFVRRGAGGRWILAERVAGLFDQVGPATPARKKASRKNPPPVPPSEWYYTRGGRRHGPVPRPTLEWLIATGRLAATDLVWKKGMSDWRPAGSLGQPDS